MQSSRKATELANTEERKSGETSIKPSMDSIMGSTTVTANKNANKNTSNATLDVGDASSRSTVSEFAIMNLTQLARQIRVDLAAITGGVTELTLENAVRVTLALMRYVETYKHMTGEQKKWVVVQVLHILIDEQSYNAAEKEQLKVLVDITIPSMIDTLVSVDKRELWIATKKTLSRVFSCCFERNSRNEI